MFLIVTRNFPPDIGGIQVLMGGLSESLLDHGPVKIFADAFDNSQLYDSKTAANVTRVKGIKLFRKLRKAALVNELFIASLNPVLDNKSEMVLHTCSGFRFSDCMIEVFNFEGIATVLNP